MFQLVMRQWSLCEWWIADDFVNKIINMLIKQLELKVRVFWFKRLCQAEWLHLVEWPRILHTEGDSIEMFSLVLLRREIQSKHSRLIILNDSIVLIFSRF